MELHAAVSDQCEVEIQELLEANSKDGITPLHAATLSNNLTLIDSLIRQGASVNKLTDVKLSEAGDEQLSQVRATLLRRALTESEEALAKISKMITFGMVVTSVTSGLIAYYGWKTALFGITDSTLSTLINGPLRAILFTANGIGLAAFPHT